MFNININIDKINQYNSFTYTNERPMDPFIRKIISLMINKKETYQQIIKDIGLKNDLYLIVLKKFEDEINEEHRLFDNEKLIEMHKKGMTIEYIDDKINFIFMPEINHYLLNNETIKNTELDLKLQQLRKIKSSYNNIIKTIIVNSTSESKYINVKTSVEFDLEGYVYFNFFKDKQLKIEIKESISKKIKEQIKNEQHLPFEIEQEDIPKEVNVSLYTKKQDDLIKKYNINYIKFDLGKILALKFTNNHIEIIEFYITKNDFHLFSKKIINFKDFNNSKNIELVMKFINEENIEFINFLSPSFKRKIIELNPQISSKMFKIDENILNVDMFNILKDNKELHLRISINKINEIKSKISSTDFIVLFNMLDDDSKNQINNPKDLKKIIKSCSIKVLTKEQKEIINKYEENINHKYELYISLIGEITISGIREKIKSIPPKELKKKGINKSFKKWLNANIGHARTIKKENIDKKMINKATEIRDITIKFLQLIKK